MPYFEHDCTKCIFLDSLKLENGNKYDLYYCENEPTVVARYGNEGYEYLSGISYPLIAILAKKLGYDVIRFGEFKTK